MRKILVVSDTHGSFTSWQRLKSIVGEVDELYHLGDVLYHGPRNPIPEGYDPAKLAEALRNENLFLVRGNCDADVDLLVLGISEVPKILTASFGQISFVMSHGEHFENDEQMLGVLEKHNAQVLFYGHTHIPRFEWLGSKLIINPGSLSLPKSRSEPGFVLIHAEENVEIALMSLSGKIVKEVSL